MAQSKEGAVCTDGEKGLLYSFTPVGFRAMLVAMFIYAAVGVAGTVLAVLNLHDLVGAGLAGSSGGEPHLEIPQVMFACAVPPALIGATMRYVRKLYLLAFHPAKTFGDTSADDLPSLRRGTYVYFFTRPPLVAVATYFLMLALVVGVLSLFMNVAPIRESGWWIVIAVSFFVGASGGYPIDRALAMGTRLTSGIFDAHKED